MGSNLIEEVEAFYSTFKKIRTGSNLIMDGFKSQWFNLVPVRVLGWLRGFSLNIEVLATYALE